MAVLLPSRAFVRVCDTSEAVKCGAVTLTVATELSTVRVLLFKKGQPGGGEQLRLRVYADSAYSDLLYTSDWYDLSSIAGSALNNNWWGWFSLAFSPRANLQATTYYFTVETNSYTRNADTFYLGLSLDWPVQQNSGSGSGIMMQLYGYREGTP